MELSITITIYKYKFFWIGQITYSVLSSFIIELVVMVIYWTECMPRKFGNEIRLHGTTGIDNLPIPLTMTLS